MKELEEMQKQHESKLSLPAAIRGKGYVGKKRPQMKYILCGILFENKFGGYPSNPTQTITLIPNTPQHTTVIFFG